MNSLLTDLYHELIMDHGRHPRHFGRLATPTHCQEGFNPFCGDRLTVYIVNQNSTLKELTFEGAGCAISMASASMMMEALMGKQTDEVKAIFEIFHQWVTGSQSAQPQPSQRCYDRSLEKLRVLSGVSRFPNRIKCATLPWHTLLAAMEGHRRTVNTEGVMVKP